MINLLGGQGVNTLRPAELGHENTDDSFKYNFFNENIRILTNIPLRISPQS